MVDMPWHGDACSLVEEFRAGRRSPAEEIERPRPWLLVALGSPT